MKIFNHEFFSMQTGKMINKKIIVQVILPVIIIVYTTVNCFSRQTNPGLIEKDAFLLKGKNFDVEVQPSTFSVSIKNKNGESVHASALQEKFVVSHLVASDNSAEWKMPGKSLQIKLELKDDYLDVDIFSDSVNNFTWPVISRDAVAYTLPWGQGKYIPVSDTQWIKFWNLQGTISGAQDLSMQFLGVNYKNFALVFIIKNMFNNQLSLKGKQKLNLAFSHEFPATVKERNYGFRIYLTKNDPAAIAKTYRNYIQLQGRLVTLEEKAEKNPNIRKLYGAPFIYLWGTQFLVKENVKDWNTFSNKIATEITSSSANISKQLRDIIKDDETRTAFNQILKDQKNADFVSQYARHVIINGINDALTSPDFYRKGLWDERLFDPVTSAYIKNGVANLTQLQLYNLNKTLFYIAYKIYLDDTTEWGNGTSAFMLNKLQQMGIKKAWLGLESFQPAYMHPGFIEAANNMGYLIGVYDSYHSIHPPGKEKWETAKFPDTTLYYTATIINKDGSFNKGFQGLGRKLNPALSMPAVQNRVNDILSNGFKFNSWFVDCDATGEVFDDYSKNHTTSQTQDAAARLQRMAWIRDAKQMVIGSEGGNDFADTTIAFAHGICSPIFIWNDLDWRKNKQSKYYFGPYFAADGGAPVQFTKQVPIKPLYHYIYYDCRFSLPLFQLVYNNCIIPSHHWSMGSLKFIDEIITNKLREILFNFPPLYNLDRKELIKQQNTIADHMKVFSKTHSKAVTQEMTGFEYITPDKQIQKTRFGSVQEIVANFSKEIYKYEGRDIPAKSLLIIDLTDNQETIYTPVK